MELMTAEEEEQEEPPKRSEEKEVTRVMKEGRRGKGVKGEKEASSTFDPVIVHITHSLMCTLSMTTIDVLN